MHVQHTFLYSLPLFCTTTTRNFQKLSDYNRLQVLRRKCHTCSCSLSLLALIFTLVAASLYTDVVLFFFTFFSKTSASLFSTSPTPNPLRWQTVNPPRVFIFYHVRSTDLRWPLAFLIFSLPLQKFHVVLQQNKLKCFLCLLSLALAVALFLIELLWPVA